MEKLSMENFKTGAKRAVATLSLVAVLAGVLMPTAHAEVLADNIIGDFDVEEDRSEIKTNDMISIIEKFKGADEEGNAYVNLEDVEKAVELSDALNSFFFDPIAYTNTKASEVVSLDINGLHTAYKAAKDSKDEANIANFCNSNLTNKPAIDAFVTFGSGNVAENIKFGVANKVCEILINKGYNITFGPIVIANETELYCLAEINGELKRIQLQGETCDNIRNTCFYLENTYNLAISTISGSEGHDLSFMYNGIEVTTNESAWLSLPDDDKKDMVKAGLKLCKTLTEPETYTLTEAASNDSVALTDEEKALLELYGVSGKTTKLGYISMTPVEAKTLTK